MFIGHYAVAFAGKRMAPSVSLGTLMLAAQFLDLLFPLFLATGLEHVRIDPGNTVVSPLDFYDYPYSHSLLAAFIWSGLFAAFYYMRRRSRRNALVLGAVMIIHWLFDVLSHRPDLQLVPGSDVRVGLGLWNSMAATFIVEAGLFVAAVALYARSTKAVDAIGRYAFWSLVVLLFVLYLSSLAGPPPPDATTLSVVSFSQWLFIAWGYWINAHRRTAMP